MKPTPKPAAKARRQRFQRGAIAVEAAIVLPVLVVFFSFPTLFWAVYFYKYSAAQKAVHDAALYLSMAPRLEMVTAGSDGSPAAAVIAKQIIDHEMAGLGTVQPSIVCSYQPSAGPAIQKPCNMLSNMDYKQPIVSVSVLIDLSYVDPLTGSNSGLTMSPYISLPYMGN